MTAVSALGIGRAAHARALLDRRSGLRPNDLADIDLVCCIGRVDGIEAAPLPAALARFECRNNRLAALALGADGFAVAVGEAVRRHGAGRVGVVLGTSTSGILSTEAAYRRREPVTGALPADFDFAHTHDLFSATLFVRAALGLRGPAATVSTACSSGAKTFAEAADLIQSGVCDAVVVGGVDSLCATTLHGFAALELLAPGPCRPFAADRRGISLGEAAAFALLEPAQGKAAPDDLRVLGVGASSDAHHMSSPHPEGAGAILAMRAALASSGLDTSEIDYVNVHGTGTRSNDAVEDLAVHAVFGSRGPWCSSTKGWTGHALGSSGALEAVLTAICLELGLVPGCLDALPLDPAMRCRIATANEPRPLRRALSNSFGFGGSNASLAIGRGP